MGVYTDGRGIAEDLDDISMFEEFHLKIHCPTKYLHEFIPVKLPLIPKALTPYKYSKNQLFYFNHKILPNCIIKEIPLPEKNSPRYLKGFSFPFLGTNNPFYELRVNPKISGKCPGKCLFCHRAYMKKAFKKEKSILITPIQIINSIKSRFTKEVFTKIDRVMVITELFGSEIKLINYIRELRELLIKAGFNPKREFGVCSTDIRTSKGISQLSNLLNPKRFSFSVEVFDKRSKLMSKYKGLPFRSIIEILSNVKKLGFEEIQINYVSGIDSLSSFKGGISKLLNMKLIDSIGFNIFTVFCPEQYYLRCSKAWHVDYYYEMISFLQNTGIKFYKPRSFEMGYPPWLL
jgi:hypothetical protein